MKALHFIASMIIGSACTTAAPIPTEPKLHSRRAIKVASYKPSIVNRNKFTR